MVAVTGCGDGFVGNHSPPPGADGTTSTSGSTGGSGTGGQLFTGGGGSGGAAVSCDACARDAQTPFEGLSAYAFGKPGEVAPCPDVAPLVGFEGFADLTVDPHACPSCWCSPAGCALPEGMYASAAKCPGDGAASLPFGPADGGWEGTCSNEAPIAAGLQCEGVACVQSLSIPAMTVEPCQPLSQGAASLPTPVWGTMVRECLLGPLSGEGCETGEVCTPKLPDSLSLCLFLKGDDPAYQCPEDYERRVVVYAGVADERACEPCACGDAQGAECGAFLSAFANDACGSLIATVITTSEEPACVDVPSGSAVGSASASVVVDKPGTCAQSGGQPSGAIEPVGPVTLCCQKEIYPPG